MVPLSPENQDGELIHSSQTKMLTVVVRAMSLLQGLQMLDHGSPQNHKRTVTSIAQ